MTAFKQLKLSRKYADDKTNYRGSKVRVNAPGLRGSRIFHDPKQPKLDMFPNPDLKCIDRAAIGRYGNIGEFKAFPLILQRAAHVAAQELYYNPLGYSISRRINEDGESRRRYSQFREAEAKVVATLIMHTSLEYNMIGKVDKGKFYHMSLKEIASRAGVGYERAKRVLRVLKQKGAMKIGKQFEKTKTGSFEGHNSIRHLTQGFWEMFGFGRWMKNERKKRSTARKEQSEGKPVTADTKLLSDKWEPKREKVMGNMQREAIKDLYMDEMRGYLTSS